MVRHTGEDFIDVKGVAIVAMLSFQATGINGTEFDAPEANCFAGDRDAAFGEKLFNTPMA